MSTINDGGPAFSCPDDYSQDGSPIYGPKNLHGMSLRDWFAGQALQGWMAGYEDDTPHPASDDCEKSVAELSYKMADAMIAARNGKEPS